MSSNATISDSEGEGSQGEPIKTPEGTPSADEPTEPRSVLSIRHRDVSQRRSERATEGDSADDSIAVMVSGPQRPWEYQPYDGEKTVDSIKGVTKGPDGSTMYKIEFESGKKDKVSLEQLLRLKNGQASLDTYNDPLSTNSNEDTMVSRSKRVRNQVAAAGFVDSATANLGSDDSASEKVNTKKRRTSEDSSPTLTTRTRTRSSAASKPAPNDEEPMNLDSDDNAVPVVRRSQRETAVSERATRSSTKTSKLVDEDDDQNQSTSSPGSDGEIVYVKQSQKTQRTQRSVKPTTKSQSKKGQPGPSLESDEDEPKEPTRRSGRDRRNVKNMQEGEVSDEVYADSDSDEDVKVAAKVLNVKEIFQALPKKTAFATLHSNVCDVCQGSGTASNKGKSELVYCQGCNTSIHRICLGNRTSREHVVTKVGDENFVMQCRRCVGVATKKDPNAPRLSICQKCDKPGLSCSPFSKRLTPSQEQTLRNANNGVDPITKVPADLINNAANVLFRCVTCRRAYHFEHLPPLDDDDAENSSENVDKIRLARFEEYQSLEQCKDCYEIGDKKIDKLIAWRPIDGWKAKSGEDYDEDIHDFQDVGEDQREYLVKFAETSYLRCKWVPGAWLWGVTKVTMRKAFFKHDKNMNPTYTTEEAIDEEYLRMEIVHEVRWKGSFKPKNEAHAKDNIHKVGQVHVKFLGLPYDDMVWEEPPNKKDEADRYSNFEDAFHEYLRGIFFAHVSPNEIDSRLAKYRRLDFAKYAELNEQPFSLTGGELMNYQLGGGNWMLYNFHAKKNVILADDMGLGKTIQVITLITALVKENPKCWPFLIVTPNATCPNWRREIKKWAPDLRVVAYYGGKYGRDKIKEHELYAGQEDVRARDKKLTAHVVITSYEGPVDSDSASFFRSVPWVGMVVDEGQRLKNSDNLLYKALTALQTPWQVLLTGTPLQNNKRELFNLLHFLDPTQNVDELDQEYAVLTAENLPKLHQLIRPFFLRRTKAKVLTTLPPISQVIIPITMSFVQKKVCQTILSKNPELIQSVLGQSKKKLRYADRGNLNNILMQLRKTLSHPFLYSKAIEEKVDDENTELRNLIDASSKFQLLELMLPKLQSGGHRVLLFSQFLEQLLLLEDFLIGMEFTYRRLDGNMNALQKQKVIDEFNAPDSEVFAMLLSTRAGGVGINLATADTVIIMDPDFNPHQDLQALSRAHRIGQKKPVLVFNLMTKDTAEEKIIQVGRSKLSLVDTMIEAIPEDDKTPVDTEAMLKHGAAAIFNEDYHKNNTIVYDAATVDKLLDRSEMQNYDAQTQSDADAIHANGAKIAGDAEDAGGNEKAASANFSHARIWSNTNGMSEYEGAADAPAAKIDMNSGTWIEIMENRQRARDAELEAQTVTAGRGRRAVKKVDYNKNDADEDAAIGPEPVSKKGKKKAARKAGNGESDASDYDAGAGVVESEPDDDEGEAEDPQVLATDSRNDRPRGLAAPKESPPAGASSGRYQQQGPGHPRSSAQPAHPNRAIHPGDRPGPKSHIAPPGNVHNPPQYSYGPPSNDGGARSTYHIAPPAIPFNGYPILPPGHQPRESSGQGAIRPPIQRPDFLMQRNNSGNAPVPSNTSLNHNRYSIPCHTCKLEHQDLTPYCPRTMSNSKIRMLLDALDKDTPKGATLYNQLRWILATRAGKKAIR